MLNGLFVVQPNQARVLILFGRYLGTVKSDGWYFVNPLASKKQISLRVRNFTSPQLKVNDANGNPIEIAAVVVWRVVDTAKAIFSVEDYNAFVEVQSETAIRHLDSQYPYDDGQNEGNPRCEVRPRRSPWPCRKNCRSGWIWPASRSSRPASRTWPTAPRSQGRCCRGSRRRRSSQPGRRSWRVAVSMVEMALDMLDQQQKVELTPERKADLVANLLVVLTSTDRSPSRPCRWARRPARPASNGPH